MLSPGAWIEIGSLYSTKPLFCPFFLILLTWTIENKYGASLFTIAQSSYRPTLARSLKDSPLCSALQCEFCTLLTLKRLGGPKRPPLDISRDYSATRKALAATLYDFFLSSFPHILTPNLWRPGVRFWSYVTFCTCTSDRKWLQNVILCTKSMQIEFFHIVHINMLIFTLNGWN